MVAARRRRNLTLNYNMKFKKVHLMSSANPQL